MAGLTIEERLSLPGTAERSVNTPVLSIVTIVLNRDGEVRDTIESVLAQKDRTIEYIVIDGGSTDDTINVVREYRDHIDLFQTGPDNGIYDAYNKGIQKARGAIIGLLPAGDTYLPGCLAEVVSLHSRYPDDILYGCAKFVSNGEFVRVDGHSHHVLLHMMIPHSAAFVPRQVYIEHGGYDASYRICADYDAFLRYYLADVPFRFIDRIVCTFDLGGVSQSHERVNDEMQQIREKYNLVRHETIVGRVFRKLDEKYLSRVRNFISSDAMIGSV